MNLTMARLQRVLLVLLSLFHLAPVVYVQSSMAGASRSSTTARFDCLPTQSQDPGLPSPAHEIIDSIKLIIPVEGVRPKELRDSFDAPRSGGRLHRAIDIIAPRGTPVLAAADGEIIRLSRNAAGGITIYQLSDDKRVVFYYAHLDRYVDDLTAGDYASQGDVIGFVGNTGNAASGSCHLHFSIWTVTDPKKYWTGVNINPYPILSEAGAAISEGAQHRQR